MSFDELWKKLWNAEEEPDLPVIITGGECQVCGSQWDGVHLVCPVCLNPNPLQKWS